MFGVPLKIGSFSVKCPTVGDIIHYDGLDNEYGEVAYYQVLSNFCATPTDLWYELWTTSKIDYRELTDFQLFCMLHSQFTMRQTKVWFGEDVDFSRMVEILDENGRHVLIDPENNILVDELIYERIMS